ncbi:hypothetical protein Tco_0745843 [Tanacetum coccineum]
MTKQAIYKQSRAQIKDVWRSGVCSDEQLAIYRGRSNIPPTCRIAFEIRSYERLGAGGRGGSLKMYYTGELAERRSSQCIGEIEGNMGVLCMHDSRCIRIHTSCAYTESWALDIILSLSSGGTTP